MLKTNLEYRRYTLYVNVSGMANKENLNILKRKIKHIIHEYKIEKIVIDISSSHNLGREFFYDIINGYNGQIKLVSL